MPNFKHFKIKIILVKNMLFILAIIQENHNLKKKTLKQIKNKNQKCPKGTLRYEATNYQISTK